MKKIKSYTARFNRVMKNCDSVKVCDESTGGCGYQKPKLTKSGLGIEIEYTDQGHDANHDRKQKLQPERALAVFEKISIEDCIILGFRPDISRPENMIIKNLAVAPPPVRPNVIMSSSNRSEDDLTYSYQKILQANN